MSMSVATPDFISRAPDEAGGVRIFQTKVSPDYSSRDVSIFVRTYMSLVGDTAREVPSTRAAHELLRYAFERAVRIKEEHHDRDGIRTKVIIRWLHDVFAEEWSGDPAEAGDGLVGGHQLYILPRRRFHLSHRDWGAVLEGLSERGWVEELGSLIENDGNEGKTADALLGLVRRRLRTLIAPRLRIRHRGQGRAVVDMEADSTSAWIHRHQLLTGISPPDRETVGDPNRPLSE